MTLQLKRHRMSINKKEPPTLPDLEEPLPQTFGYFPYEVALIIDDVIYDIFNVDGQQAAQYMAQPKFVLFNPGEAKLGWIYKDGELSYPEGKISYPEKNIPGV